MRLLIADSGATKTDWVYIRDGIPDYVRTIGLHPSYLDQEEKILEELRSDVGSFEPDALYFYGAGCYSQVVSEPIERLMRILFGNVQLKLFDDLTAVAHLQADQSEGVVSILGTGSASGYFRNGTLISQVPSLGYVLGDEGGAADIGKQMLIRSLRKQFSPETNDYLESRLGPLEYHQLMDGLYHSKRPSFYLAQISKQVLSGAIPTEIKELLHERFQAWVDVHLKAYPGFPEYSLTLTGGVANAYKTDLELVLTKNHVTRYDICDRVITELYERYKNLTHNR